jgi:hypothetical protein
MFLCCCIIVAFMFVALGIYLQSHCLETAVVYVFISWSLHSNGSALYSMFKGLFPFRQNSMLTHSIMWFLMAYNTQCTQPCPYETTILSQLVSVSRAAKFTLQYMCSSSRRTVLLLHIVMDLLEALLGNSPVNMFQQTCHATILWKCFLRVCVWTIAIQCLCCDITQQCVGIIWHLFSVMHVHTI